MESEEKTTLREEEIIPPEEEPSAIKRGFFSMSWWAYLLLGLLSIVIKLIWEISNKPKEYEHTLSKAAFPFLFALLGEIGVALVVFAFVTLTIERFNRDAIEADFRRFLRKIEKKHKEVTEAAQNLYAQHINALKNDMFAYHFGVVVQKEVLHGLIKMVFTERFYRKDLVITYDFERFNEKELLLTENIEYKLFNIGIETAEYKFQHYMDNIYSSTEFEDRMVLFEIKSNGSVVFTKDEQELKGISKTDGVRCVFKEGANPTVQIEPGQFVTVKFCSKSVRRFVDSQSFISILPARNLRLFVYIPKDVQPLKIDVDSAHIVKPFPEVQLHNKTRQIWDIPEVLLPGNGVLIYWRPE